MGFINANPDVYKLYDSFEPSLEEKKEFNEDLDKFKFYCWLPESLMAVGDAKILFNSVEELRQYWHSPFTSYVLKYHKPASEKEKYWLEE